MRYGLALVLLCGALTGCDTLPHDAASTTDRIMQSRQMRVAILPGTPDTAAALTLLGDYAAKHGARLSVVPAHGEHALRWLDDGKVDAVVGHFARKSPWRTDISLSKPVGQEEPPDGNQPILRIARRNGENALILATDRAVAQSDAS